MWRGSTDTPSLSNRVVTSQRLQMKISSITYGYEIDVTFTHIM